MIESPRFFVAGGSLAALIGAALILPVVVARIESGVWLGSVSELSRWAAASSRAA